MFTVSYTFIELKSSTLVSDLYGLMQRILCLICITPHCKFTVPLVNTVLSQRGLYMAFHICMQCGW